MELVLINAGLSPLHLATGKHIVILIPEADF